MIKQMNILKCTAICAAVLSLAACSHSEGEGKAPASQVVAKVNGAEISVHQINNVLARAQGVTAENAPQAKNEVLDKLIDQQLAIEQATAKKLDRSPNVMQAIEAAKRDILARAFLEQVATAQPKPTADEVRKFYAEHPELFAERRIFNLQELAIPANALPEEELKQILTSAKSMQDVAKAFKAKNVPFRANANVSPAEQLPLELLPKIHTMKDGQTSVIQSPQALMIVHLAASQAQPIAEADATPRIEQFISNKRNSEAIAKEMKALREAAKIEKLGEFANAPAKPAAAAAPAAAPAAEAAAAPAAAPAPAPAPAGVDEKALAKGISGLK